MLKNVIDLTSHEAKGLNTNPNIFSLTKDQSPNMMNVKVENDGAWSKRLGTVTMNTLIIADSAAVGFSPTGSITSNLIAFWRMNETDGDRYDAYGGNTLTNNNNIMQAAGINKQAALFVSSNSQYLLRANTSTLATGDIDFGMSAWFYLNSTSTTKEMALISKRDNVVGNDVTLLCHCDGNNASTALTDNSLSARAFTTSGNAQISTAQSKFGGASALFDGTGDYFFTPDNIDLRMSSSSFTIDFWIMPATTSGALGVTEKSLTGSQQSYRFFVNNRRPTFDIFPASQVAVTLTGTTLFDANIWHHVACVRNSDNLLLFIDGIQEASTSGLAGMVVDDDLGPFCVGALSAAGGSPFNGYIEEFRLIKGRAAYTSNFTVPSAAYSNPANPSQYEYYLYINTDNVLTFRVSNSGTGGDITVRATSFGAVTTSTWYNAVAYHSANSDLLAVGVNLSMNSSAYTTGVRSGSAPFVIGAISNGESAFFDGRIDEVGFWKRDLNTTDRSNLYNSGNANTYQNAFGRDSWASFDFGAGTNKTRWLTVAAATGIYASSNLGLTWVTIATDRSANYQYFERSKNILVSGSDSYDTPLYWAGSAATFMSILNVSSPLVKYWINFQGFLIGLNSSTRKRGFFYEDENTQLTGGFNGTLTAGGNFDIPSSADDELTTGFVLRRRLYCSTRYFLYGVDYQGGNPDWNYRKTKDFGFVPRTVRIMQLEGVGEVAIGLDWGNKLRIFDGAEDKIVSNQVEIDNGICDFAFRKVSSAGSGKIVSFAEVDRNENIYRLCVAIGGNSTQTTHFINYNRNQAFYPDDNRPFNTMCSAESNQTQYTMAFDRSGRCHMLDSGNKDAGITPIQDVLDLNYLFDKSPSQAQKNHMLDLYFLNNTAGTIFIKESVNFDRQFADRNSFVISGTGRKQIYHKSVDIPSETNSYQPRITTSGGTSDPWKLMRYDFFTEGMGIGKTQ